MISKKSLTLGTGVIALRPLTDMVGEVGVRCMRECGGVLSRDSLGDLFIF
jgi:hypothetical protein